MKNVNLWLYRLKTYLIKRYLIKELENRMRRLEEEIKKLNPIELLAIKNGLKLKLITLPHSLSEDFCFPEVIYEDFLENKYVSNDLGFVPIERHNAQVELMEIRIKYNDLLNNYSKLEIKFEKENEELKKMESKISELNILIRILNNQVRTLKDKIHAEQMRMTS